MSQPAAKFQAFERQNSLFTLPRINTIDHLAQPTPSFIQMKMVNRQKVAFLGNEPIDHDKFHNTFYRVDKMVIPAFTRMVHPDHLRAHLETSTDTRAIDVEKEHFFLADKLSSNVLLNVVGLTAKHTFKNMHFHFCQNHTTPHALAALDKSHAMSAQCQHPHISSYHDENGELQHKLVLFYMTKEDIFQSFKNWVEHEVGDEGNFPVDFSIKTMLSLYFTDQHYKTPSTFDDDPTLDWSDKELLKGVFLLPVTQPDKSVMYLCLLNVDGKSNTNKPVKETLKMWLDAVDDFNKPAADGNGNVFDISGNDFVNMWIEPWSIYIGKNMVPEISTASKTYKKSVLEHKLS